MPGIILNPPQKQTARDILILVSLCCVTKPIKDRIISQRS